MIDDVNDNTPTFDEGKVRTANIYCNFPFNISSFYSKQEINSIMMFKKINLLTVIPNVGKLNAYYKL